MRNVVLLCECGFTCSGLTTLMRQEAHIFSTASVAQCQAHLLRAHDGDIDLVVLSLRRSGVDTLLRLSTLLRRQHPSCRVLIDPGSASIPLLRFYLNCLHYRTGLIDFTLPVQALQGGLMLAMHGVGAPLPLDITDGDWLSVRERNVLRALLGELTAHDIARTLALSIKTISHYKRAGLRKLGARNLQDLVIPSVHRVLPPPVVRRPQSVSDTLPLAAVAVRCEGGASNGTGLPGRTVTVNEPKRRRDTSTTTMGHRRQKA